MKKSQIADDNDLGEGTKRSSYQEDAGRRRVPGLTTKPHFLSFAAISTTGRASKLSKRCPRQPPSRSEHSVLLRHGDRQEFLHINHSSLELQARALQHVLEPRLVLRFVIIREGHKEESFLVEAQDPPIASIT